MKANEINTVSSYEYIKIVSTIEAILDKKFNCFSCQNMYSKNQDYEKKRETYKAHTNKRRAKQNCFSLNDRCVYQLENIKYYTCVGNFYDKSVCDLYEMYTLYDKGVLPYNGALVDQPAKIIEVFQLIGGLRAEKIERLKKEVKDAKRNKS